MSKWLSAARREALSDLAGEVLAEFCSSLPVQPANILKSSKLTMSFGRYGSAFDGMLECKAGRFHVFCNLDRVETEHSPRARFTLAHELAHYYIDEHRNALEAGKSPPHPSLCEYTSLNPIEREADFFAGRLLMPEERLRDEARAAGRGLAGITHLSEIFRTSVTSTAIRYAELDLFPCAVIKWNPDGSYGWKWLSGSTFQARYRKTIERSMDVPSDSATARALRNEPRPTKGFFENGSVASCWFPFVDDDSYRNAIMMEQAVPLGRFGALTFLFPEAGHF